MKKIRYTVGWEGEFKELILPQKTFSLITSRISKGQASFENNSLLVRHILALMVIISHSFAITGNGEPVIAAFSLSNHSYAWLALNGFFFLSGMLVSQSYCKRPIKDYAIARGLRILPAYYLALIGSLVVPLIVFQVFNRNLFVEISRYFGHNLFPVVDSYGYFRDFYKSNPIPCSVNSSIWSIPYEIFCYVFVLPALFTKLRPINLNKIYFILFLVMWVRILNLISERGMIDYDKVRIIFYFALGALVYKFIENKNKLLIIPILITLLGAAFCVGWGNLLVDMIFFGILITVAFLFPYIWKTKIDISYGLYIYAFPIQQLLVAFAIKDPLKHMVFTITLTAFISFLSWHLLESKMLKLKNASRYTTSMSAIRNG